MKWIWRFLILIFLVLGLALFLFHTPDTDPTEMRAKYGAPPSQYITLKNGQNVHLRDEGPRDAPPIILLHGSSSDLHTWEPWAQNLREDYRVIRFDQIGHGLTGPAKDEKYELASFIETVDLVAEELGLERFVLGGNSMGGWIAAGYAQAHPGRLSGLVLVDASGAPIKRESGGGNIGFTIAAIPVVNNLMTQITPRSLVKSSYEQSVSNQAIVTDQAVDRYWELLRFPGNRSATITRFNTEREVYTKEAMAMINIPTLLMWGEEDRLVPFDAAIWYQDVLPNATLVSYPDIGHLPMEETAEESASDLREWLSGLSLSDETG